MQPGRCFRFVHAGTGHAQHCPEPVVLHGQFVDGTGKQWQVDACTGHAKDLTAGGTGQERTPGR